MSDIPFLRGAASSRMRGNFVMLRADTLRLLLPQQDVSSTEYIDRMPSGTAAAGIFSHSEADSAARNVVALSDQMHALATFPGDRFLLTRLPMPSMSCRSLGMRFASSSMLNLSSVPFPR